MFLPKPTIILQDPVKQRLIAGSDGVVELLPLLTHSDDFNTLDGWVESDTGSNVNVADNVVGLNGSGAYNANGIRHATGIVLHPGYIEIKGKLPVLANLGGFFHVHNLQALPTGINRANTLGFVWTTSAITAYAGAEAMAALPHTNDVWHTLRFYIDKSVGVWKRLKYTIEGGAFATETIVGDAIYPSSVILNDTVYPCVQRHLNNAGNLFYVKEFRAYTGYDITGPYVTFLCDAGEGKHFENFRPAACQFPAGWDTTNLRIRYAAYDTAPELTADLTAAQLATADDIQGLFRYVRIDVRQVSDGDANPLAICPNGATAIDGGTAQVPVEKVEDTYVYASGNLEGALPAAETPAPETDVRLNAIYCDGKRKGKLATGAWHLGRKWTLVKELPSVDDYIEALATDSTGKVFGVGGTPTGGIAYTSSDNGETWALLQSVPGQLLMNLSGGFNSAVFAVSFALSGQGKIYRSVDAAPFAVVKEFSNGNGFAVLQISATIIIASESMTGLSKIWRSTDGGDTWEDTGYTHSTTAGFQRFTNCGNGVILGVYIGYGRVAKSIDNGATWQVINPNIAGFYSNKALVYVGDGVVLLGGQISGSPGGVIIKSTDHGSTWALLSTVDYKPYSIAHLGNSRLILCCFQGDDQSVLLSDDLGLTWELLDDLTAYFAADAIGVNSDLAFVTCDNFIYKSVNDLDHAGAGDVVDGTWYDYDTRQGTYVAPPGGRRAPRYPIHLLPLTRKGVS